MKLFRLNMLASVFLTGILWSPAWAARTALPGTLNYYEGHAAIGHQVLAPQSIGSTILQPGESLTTTQGKAEVLLMPGVFFRVGDSSSAIMVTSGLAIDLRRAAKLAQAHHQCLFQQAARGQILQ